MTKAESETVIRSHLDDAASKRWGSSEFDLIVSATYDSCWRALLVQFPWLLTQRDDITSALTSPGYVTLTTAGELTQRFHGLISITRDGRQYSRGLDKNVVLQDDAVVVAPDYTYVRWGDELHLFPYDTTADLEIRYSYIPPVWSGLADGASIVWPEGHELAFTYAAATRLGAKGESEELGNWGGLAGIEWGRMLESIKAASPGGIAMFMNDTPEGWGSVG